MTALLRTKIQLPPLRQQHIRRERLLRKVSAYPGAHLLLVSAPAGFGKSTWLLQWALDRQRDGALVAWYSLDERDNDPTRFAAYLLDALRVCGIKPLLPDVDDRIEVQEAITIVSNTVTQLDKRVVLALDDYHLITEPQIHDAINRMCEYIPSNMKLAIGTRIDPPLPLARLRSRRELAEIRMADLRFNTEELREWCGVSLGWTPSRRSVENLEQATEGWAAALALIMMSQSHTDEQTLETQLARYSHSQRHIFDYFAQEILEHQPEEVQQFLLNTSILNELRPELCRQLTDSDRAPWLLNRLAGESLFIIPLSNTEPTYRYHHLFAQFMRQYLVLKNRARYLKQHRRAAEWYAAHDSIVQAVDHALAAEDLDYAATLIEDRAWAPLTSRGEFMTLINWQRQFSVDVLAKHPRLWLYFVRAFYLTGHVQLAETHVRLAVEALDPDSGDVEAQQALRAIAFNWEATLAAYRGDLETASYWIEQANALQSQVSDLDWVRIANTGAFIRYLMGDVLGARRAYLESLALAERLNHQWQMLGVHSYLAQLDLLSGDLQAVQERCEGLLDSYPKRIAPLVRVMLPLAAALYQRNQTVEAEMLLRDAIAMAKSTNQPSVSFHGHVALSEMLLARGETAEALASISHARAFAAGYQSPVAEALISAAEARVLLQSGQLEEAASWAEQYQQPGEVDYHQDYEKITLAQVWLAQGEHEQALELLARIIKTAQAAGRTFSVINAEIVRALAYQASADRDSALSALERALTLAAPQRFVRLFIDIGRPMLMLLRRAVAQDLFSDYAQYLLDSAGRADVAPHPADLLTEREVEVLEHVATGASNQEIADALVISMGTVKSHIHRIMNKLGAQNRTEAVSNARSLNLLDE